MNASALSSGDSPAWIWRNGALVPWAEATVHVNAVGHASVSAVFEGIKAYRSHDGRHLHLFRLEDHLDRLERSARLARLATGFSTEQLAAACLDLLRANRADDDTYLRPWLFPEGVIREQMVPAGARCETVIDSWSFVSRLGSPSPCRAGISSWQRLDESIAPPRIKAFSNYHNGRLALIEAHAHGYDWPILLNRQGKVSEGAAACVAAVVDGRVVTPPVTAGLLPGLTRETAIVLLGDLGIPVDVRDLDRSELYLAEEVFFLGTAWEVLPVGSVDGFRIGSGDTGPVTAALESRYTALVRGHLDDRHGWLTRLPCPTPASDHPVGDR